MSQSISSIESPVIVLVDTNMSMPSSVSSSTNTSTHHESPNRIIPSTDNLSIEEPENRHNRVATWVENSRTQCSKMMGDDTTLAKEPDHALSSAQGQTYIV